MSDNSVASKSHQQDAPPNSDRQESPHKNPFVWLYHITKTLLIWVIMLVLTIFHGALATIVGIIFRSPTIVHWIATSWGTILFYLPFNTYKVIGREKLYKDGPVLVLTNHQSMYDIPFMYVLLRGIQFRWMAKASLFKIWFMGWGMSGAGYIPVERTNTAGGAKSIMQAADTIKKKNASVLMFPEGTRSTLPDGELLPFKMGAFTLAKRSNIVVQPITIWGSRNVIPIQPDFKIQRIYGSKLKAIIHDPIMPEEYAGLEPEELAKKVKAKIGEPIEELNREIPVKDGQPRRRRKAKK